MVSTVQNTDVKEKDADRAVVVAVTSHAAFGAGDGRTAGDDEPYGVGVAFTLLQALQRVNERLLEENPAESLLFDVVLITTTRQQQQQSARLISSTRHYGLEVSRFCFSSEEDFIESLLQNNVQLFLSPDSGEVLQASQAGVHSTLLSQQATSCPSEQLRVLFCGDDAIWSDISLTLRFLSQLGKMRQQFNVSDSPLSIVLMTYRSGRESCGEALRMLRSHGITVDEAYCLAGAPRGPILSLLRPHFLLSDVEE